MEQRIKYLKFSQLQLLFKTCDYQIHQTILSINKK